MVGPLPGHDRAMAGKADSGTNHTLTNPWPLRLKPFGRARPTVLSLTFHSGLRNMPKKHVAEPIVEKKKRVGKQPAAPEQDGTQLDEGRSDTEPHGASSGAPSSASATAVAETIPLTDSQFVPPGQDSPVPNGFMPSIADSPFFATADVLGQAETATMPTAVVPWSGGKVCCTCGQDIEGSDYVVCFKGASSPFDVLKCGNCRKHSLLVLRAVPAGPGPLLRGRGAGRIRV